MSSIPVGGSFIPVGGAARFSGRTEAGYANNLRYPSPWWDLASMDLPRSVKHLFRWCLYHVIYNPLVSATVRKMAAYPITEVILEDSPTKGFEKNKERWSKMLFRTLKITRRQLEIAFDYFAYGNCVVSLAFPFRKHLVCTGCGARHYIKRLRYRTDWIIKGHKHELTCPSCGHEGPCTVQDIYVKDADGIRLIRWNPNNLDIDYNPITQETAYFYRPPDRIRARVQAGYRSYWETFPQELLESIRMGRPFELDNEHLYHFKAPTPSLPDGDEGWGYPPILPALKDSYYLQLMKKAQEAILMEHLIPLDILFPSGEAVNPYQSVDLGKWREQIEAMIQRWRWDPNYKPVLPLPVGFQRVGGTGKALLLVQEIRVWSEQVIAGMGAPQEFVFGGLSYSGSSVSLRMLENQFLTDRQMHADFLEHFLMPRISRYMGWTPIHARMKEFKMADDMQYKQMLLSLANMQKLSDESLLADFGRKASDELNMILEETRRRQDMMKQQGLAQAHAQSEIDLVNAKSQMKIQQLQQAQMQQMQGGAMPPGGDTAAPETATPQVDPVEMARVYGRQLAQMDPNRRNEVLQKMQQTMPNVAALVAAQSSAIETEKMEPLPEQRPPRRRNALV